MHDTTAVTTTTAGTRTRHDNSRPLAVALANRADAVPPALAGGEAVRQAHVLAVAPAHAGAHEPVALRQAVPRLRHPRRPQLCAPRAKEKSHGHSSCTLGCAPDGLPEAVRRGRTTRRADAAARREEVAEAISSLRVRLDRPHGSTIRTGVVGTAGTGTGGVYIGVQFRALVQKSKPAIFVTGHGQGGAAFGSERSVCPPIAFVSRQPRLGIIIIQRRQSLLFDPRQLNTSYTVRLR
jgi:hypothetical protein